MISFTNVNTTGASGGMQVTGLPFAGKSGTRGTAGTPMIYGLSIPNKTISAFLDGGLTRLEFYSSADNAPWAEVTITAGSPQWLFITITYLTDN